MLDVCYGPSVDLPTDECDECAAYLARVERLEDMLDGYIETTITAEDEDGHSVTLHVLAIIEEV